MTILAAGAIVAGAAQAAGHASDVADAEQNIRRKVDGQRSVVLIVDNRTDPRLELVGESHDHGGWGANPVAGTPPKSVMVCGSKDRGFMTGTAGRMTYRIKDKQVPANDVLLGWSNPFVGRNKASGSAYFTAAPALRLPSTRDRVVVTCGAGDKGAEMRDTARPL